MSILGELMPGYMISDVPVILGSLDFVMGEMRPMKQQPKRKDAKLQRMFPWRLRILHL